VNVSDSTPDLTALVRPVHAEVFTSERTGETISLRCECAIGRSHSFEETQLFFKTPRGDRLERLRSRVALDE
jgi:hypothetical protein